MKDNNLFSRYFPVPKILEMPWVGIDISPASIRCMEIISHPHPRVGSFAEVILKKPFAIGDTDHKEVKDILIKWKKEYGFHYVKVSFPEEKAYLFETQLELDTEEHMRSAIEFVLEENVPISGREAAFDFRLLGNKNEKGMINVAVTVLPKDTINSYLSLFEECGLTPISFLTEAQAVSRALINKESQDTYIIVNIGTVKTGVFIVSQGGVQFTSTFPTGSVDFTRELQKQLGVTMEEAEVLKSTKGLLWTGDAKVAGALLPMVSMLKDEVYKVSVYWSKHRSAQDPSIAIKKIILSGKESLMPGFREYIAQTLKTPTEVGNVWENLASIDEYIPPLSLSSAVGFASSIGLALPENE
jgi:type IV pilus assembly protein PilM